MSVSSQGSAPAGQALGAGLALTARSTTGVTRGSSAEVRASASGGITDHSGPCGALTLFSLQPATVTPVA